MKLKIISNFVNAIQFSHKFLRWNKPADLFCVVESPRSEGANVLDCDIGENEFRLYSVL